MEVEHPTSGTVKNVLGSWHRLWCLIFGPLYYACKGMWGWAVISFLTFNGILIIMPLWNRTIVRSHYENNGWRIIAFDKIKLERDYFKKRAIQAEEKILDLKNSPGSSEQNHKINKIEGEGKN